MHPEWGDIHDVAGSKCIAKFQNKAVQSENSTDSILKKFYSEQPEY